MRTESSSFSSSSSTSFRQVFRERERGGGRGRGRVPPYPSRRPYFSLANVSLTFSKLGKSFGVGVCSLYWTTHFLSITNAARAAVSPMPASMGNTTLYCLMTSLLRSLASVTLIFSFCAQASCANGVSTLMPTTSAFKPEYAPNPAVMSHISLVQTLVNAAGKNSRTVFFLPRLLLSFTSTSPEGCLDFRVKSGALLPTGIAIIGASVIVKTLHV